MTIAMSTEYTSIAYLMANLTNNTVQSESVLPLYSSNS